MIDGRQGRLARLDGLAVLAAVGEAAGHRHAPAAEAEERGRGAAGEEIGHPGGRGVRQLALDLHVRDQRRADLASDCLQRFLQPRARLDERAGAAAQRGEAPEEPVVHRGVDPDGEDALLAQLRLQPLEHARLVAHLPVGEQHHDRDAAFAAGLRPDPGERFTHRAVQLGPAAREHRAQPLLAPLEAALVGLRETARHPLDDVVERQRCEPVARPERAQEQRAGARGGGHLRPLHRAGAIDDEDHVARRPEKAFARGRDQGEHSEPAVHQQLRLHLLGGQPPAQDEIAVERLALARELHACALGTGGRAHRVLRALEIFQGAEQLGFDIQRNASIESRDEPRRRDPRRVRHGRAVGNDAVSGLLARQLLAADVAGRDHQRQPQLGAAVLEEGQPLRIRQAHRDSIARRDVADLDGEDVVAFLFEQRRALALIEGLRVLPPRLAALFDLRLQDARADLHLEPADGAPAGEREDVDGFDRLGKRILKFLLDDHFRDAIDHARFQRNALQRQRRLARRRERTQPPLTYRNVDHRNRERHRLPPLSAAIAA